MPANTVPIFALTSKVLPVTFVNADGVTPKDVFIAGSFGGKCSAILVCSDDTVARTFQVFLRRSSTNYLLGTKVVPTLSGTNGSAPTVNLLDPTLIPGLDLDGALFLPTGDSIRVAPTVAITAAKTATVTGVSVDY